MMMRYYWLFVICASMLLLSACSFCKKTPPANQTSLTALDSEGISLRRLAQDYSLSFSVEPSNTRITLSGAGVELIFSEGLSIAICNGKGFSLPQPPYRKNGEFFLTKNSVSAIPNLYRPQRVQHSRVIIDAGHGGKDTGAQANRLNEKDLNLSLAILTSRILRTNGISVFLTREDDTYLTLDERVAIGTAEHADAFVSIHLNAADEAVQGIETYFYPSHKDARKLATYVHAAMIRSTRDTDRKVKEDGFYVLKNARGYPAILVETGFITHSETAHAMSTDAYKLTVANAIAQGIIHYLNAR